MPDCQICIARKATKLMNHEGSKLDVCNLCVEEEKEIFDENPIN